MEEVKLLENKPSIYDQIVKVILYLTVFLIPLFFLPLSSDPLELNKAMLFYILVALALLIWFLKVIIFKEITFTRTPFNFLVTIFGLIYLISALFSSHHYTSFIGLGGFISGSFVSVIFLILFYFLIINHLNTRKEILRLIAVLLASSGIIIIFSLFQSGGNFILPYSFAKINIFNLVSPSSIILSIFLSVILVISLLFSLFLKDKFYRLLSIVLFFLALVLSFLHDQNLAWYVLLGGLFILVAFLAIHSQKIKATAIILITLLVIVTLAFIFINARGLTKLDLTETVVMDYGLSLDIAGSAFRNNPLIGTGPLTFGYSLAEFRNLEYNSSPFADIRFVKSRSEWIETLSTTGIFSTLALLAMVVYFLVKMTKKIIDYKETDRSWLLLVTCFTAWFGLFLAGFIYFFGFVLAFLFWLFFALSIKIYSIEEPKVYAFSFKNKTTSSFILSLVFVLFLIGVISLGYGGIRIWLAEYSTSQAQATVRNQEDLDKAGSHFARAIEYNKYPARYYFNYAQNLVVQSALESQKENPDLTKVQDLTSQAISNIQAGLEKEKNYSVRYETAGDLYLLLRLAVGYQANISAAEVYQKAVGLEPQNHLLHFKLGQNYLTQAQDVKLLFESGDISVTQEQTKEFLNLAKASLEKATQLKNNFLEAELVLIQVLELLGENDQALMRLEALAQNNPFTVDIWLALAQRYELVERSQEALTIYEQLLNFYPEDEFLKGKIEQLKK